MNTPDRSLADNEIFSIAELEARFEMQAIAVPTNAVVPDWKCGCTFEK